MSVLEYRQRVLDKIADQSPDVALEVNSFLDIAHSKEKIGELIGVISDSQAPTEQKSSAIDLLSVVSNFSPSMRAMMPEFVDALRSQVEAASADVRMGAISTLTALKDDVVQERLLEDITSGRSEEERLVPTADAISMLGRDKKALPAHVLRDVMMNPPTPESQVEAVRQMPSDPNICDELISLMRDESVPFAARAMIPEMVSDADPNAFLSAAENMLNDSGANNELAPWLVKAMSNIKASDANEALESAKGAVSRLRKGAPASFESAAQTLLDANDAAES